MAWLNWSCGGSVLGFVLVGSGAPTRAGVRPLEGPTVSTPVIKRSTTTEPLLRLGA